MATSVPQIQFTTAGPIAPATDDVLAGVQVDVNTAFGGGVNPALNTPQGQLATSQAASTDDKNSEFLFLVNMFDPQYATGRYQDALARIYFLTRKGAVPTVVTCILGGVVAAPIPAGTLAQDTAGNTYVLLDSVVIGGSGTVASQWANLTTGDIPCLEGTLTRVYQSVPGWDTITNPSDGTPGNDVESASSFELRRQNSVAINSQGSTGAIYAAVFSVANVLDCYVIDNPLGTTVDTGSTNYPLVAHSVYVAVLGGDDAQIAQAIWSKKDLGCSYNGNTTVAVQDMSGYNFPYPTYQVTFERTTPLPIFFTVTIANSPSLPSNLTAQVQAAIIARFNGTDGTIRERIGSTILASRYYSAVGAIATNITLLGILVGDTSPGAATSQPVGIDQNPTLNAGNIAVNLV